MRKLHATEYYILIKRNDSYEKETQSGLVMVTGQKHGFLVSGVTSSDGRIYKSGSIVYYKPEDASVIDFMGEDIDVIYEDDIIAYESDD